MKKALNWSIVLLCTSAVLVGFTAFLPLTTEAAGCQIVIKAQVGCCFNQRRFVNVCADGSYFFTCSGICGPIP